MVTLTNVSAVVGSSKLDRLSDLEHLITALLTSDPRLSADESATQMFTRRGSGAAARAGTF